MSRQNETPSPEPRFRVLAVDDDRLTVCLIREMLRDHGFDVVIAESGEEALELIEAEYFDVALINYKMPGLDGLEVIRRAKRLCPHLPIVLTSAFATAESTVHALQEGADDFLLKPFRKEELLAIVGKQLGTIQKRRERQPRTRFNSEGRPLP